MIIVTNQTDAPVTCAAKQFDVGENRFKDSDLSPAKLAQISNHPALKWVKVEDRPVEQADLNIAARADLKIAKSKGAK